MRLTYGHHPASEELQPYRGIAGNFFLHEPYHFMTRKNDDGSYKQSHTHKSVEFRILIWNTMFWIELDYKRVELPKKFPKPRRKRET